MCKLPFTLTFCSPVPGFVKRSTCILTSPTLSSSEHDASENLFS